MQEKAVSLLAIALQLASVPFAQGVELPPTLARRQLLRSLAAGSISAHAISVGVLSAATIAPAAALAAAPAASLDAASVLPRANVASWPGVEYLEPIYELKLSIDALASSVTDVARWPAIAARLKRFFGGPLSEQFYFRGLSQQYSNAIQLNAAHGCPDCTLPISKRVYSSQYGPTHPAQYNEVVDSLVDEDKTARQRAMEDALGGLRRMKELLEAKVKPTPEALAAEARAAQKGIADWLALSPSKDVAEADELIRAVRVADVDLDGRLSSSELATLPEQKQREWKARVDLVGE